MHPDLSHHLHTERCNVLIEALMKCHEEHKVGKFFGKCNEFDSAVNRCLIKEYHARRDANRFRKRKQKAAEQDSKTQV
ncbi:COX assembly mitochondrial protein 2 homolog [Gigantopelta aegis]|uniref:COX assembly mitochondrial protein 2 homolog n=1 Tax=Gigantopelta aegis TaxID=1735272 RepID=UPI001B887D78|nr:COX assembly mitochondrial protein 2 homolog [Gigantopelta aegis]XP_041376999.1 COX assembly mitochondrial protein 2 homolog [Gigantopelta aegis]XP_041377000.1 COX assembly mitochondrial protein 2 homolog [Gigantopelta aegis]